MSSSMFDFHPGIFGFGGLGAFRILFAVVFVGIVFVMLFNAGKSLSQWSKNNRSPRLTVNARVVAKRENVSVRHHHGNGTGHTTRSTTYYVTFQFDGGDRSELRLSGPEYGRLAEGDQGLLTFQGTRYLGFERRRHTMQRCGRKRKTLLKIESGPAGTLSCKSGGTRRKMRRNR